jgi:UDP-glucuronate decarboxylase
VSDLVVGLIRLMNRDGVFDPVNLGNPGEFTILELAQKVLEMVNTPSKIIHRPLPPDDPGRRRPDITRARELLDWQPTVPLDTGLQKTIPYFDRRLREEKLPVVGSLNF